MRLICPNCGAQYEVDAQVIPDGGRDVQCSNCGHTWFQRPAAQDPDLADELGIALPDWEDEPDEPETVSAEIPDDYEDDPEPAPEPAVEMPRRELDKGVLDILREEAERETDARVAEGGAFESQPDLGLDDSNKPGLRERMARLRGGDQAELAGAAAAAAAATGKRRDLLPDIEEINSTLRADTPQAPDSGYEDDADFAPARQRGFGQGFALVLMILAILVAIYAMAPSLAQSLPFLEGPLTAYVSAINALRDTVDTAMQGAVAKLTALLSQLDGKG